MSSLCDFQRIILLVLIHRIHIIYGLYGWMCGRSLTDNMAERRRTSITFPAEITKRGNARYITVLKSYMEMLGVAEGDLVDVTITIPKDTEMRDDERGRFIADRQI